MMDNMENTQATEIAENKADAIATQEPALPDGPRTIWNDPQQFKVANYMAKLLSTSDLVPEGTYRNKPANCIIALEMAQRMNLSPLHVMQNLFVIKGKPAWSGQFCIAAANGSGMFTPLEFVQLTNEDGSTRGYYARAARISDGKICEGPPVDWDMVKGEGWFDKSGSKWKTMPDLMFRYRAAAFFVRTFCPEVLCGLQTYEEVQDVKGYNEPERKVVTF